MPGLRQWFAESLTYKWARRIAISLIGGTVILIGVAMIVLPGPAMVVIPLGLGILGLEFAWARSWLAKVRQAANGLAGGLRKANPWRRTQAPKPPPNEPPPVD
jgi:hypothetical protein